MVLNLVWLYFLILYSDFTLSNDVIETDGIPSYWKQHQEIVNNPDLQIHSLQDKKPKIKILNYGLGIQRPTKIIPNDLLSYKIMQSTKNATDRNLNSFSDTKPIHSNDMKVENKNVIYDKQNTVHEHNKGIDKKLEKWPKDTDIESTSNEFKNVDTFEKPKHAELDIVHEKDKLVMLLPQKNDTSSHFSNQGLTKSEEPEEHENEISKNNEQNNNENNDELIFKSHDLNRRTSVNSDEIKNDEIIRDDQQNFKPKFIQALYNPKGWIRYYRPNQYSLSNHSNYNIKELYSRTKYSNPFYVTQSPFTRHLRYGVDKRYRKPDFTYQIGL